MASDLKLEVQLGLTDKLLGPLKRVRQGAGDVSKALAATRDQVKALQVQQADVSGYRKASIAIIKQGRELKGLEETQRHYSSELERQRNAHANLTGNLKAARTQYNKLSKALIEGKGESAEFQRELEKAQIKLLSSEQAFSRSQKTIKTYGDRLRHAKEKHGQLSQQQRNAQDRLVGLKTKLDAAGIGTDNLSRKAREQRDELKKLNGVYDQHKQKLKELGVLQKRNEALNAAHGKSMAHAAMVGGGGYAMLNAGRSATNSLMGPVRAYADFEDAMAGVAKQVEGARNANGQLTPTYYEMSDAIKAMSERIPMASTEIAALVEGGARMGIQGKDNLLAFAEVAANAATAFELPADQIGENLARIADLYKIPIQNVSQLGDAINYLDDNAKSKGADIIEVLQRTAGVTASVGMSYQDSAALGSTFLTLGASAETAATATKAMIRELAIATEQPKRFQKGLSALGLDAAAVQKSMARDATGTIQQVLDAINRLPKDNQLSVATQLFGDEFGDDASNLANNIAEYRRQLELANAEAGKGSMQKEADIAAQLLSKRWLMTQNKLFNALSEAGESLKPVLIDLMEAASGFLGGLRDWIKENPTLASGILQAAVGLTVLATALGAGAIALAGFMAPFSILQFTMAKLLLNSAGTKASMAQLFPTFIKAGQGLRSMATAAIGLAKSALPALAAGVRMLGVALFTTPLGWFLLAITAIAAAAYAIWANWDTLGPKFAALWSGIQAGAGVAWDWLQAKAVAVGQAISSFFLNWTLPGLIYQHWDTIMAWMGQLPGRFMAIGTQVMQGMVQGITNGLSAVKGAITGAADSTVGWFKEKLGIHSPSRVFAELGGFTMQGLEQGLVGSQGGPLGAVTAMAKQLAAAGAVTFGLSGPALAMDNRPPLSAVSTSGARAAATPLPPVTVNIYPSAGMNEQQLAQLVGQKVAEAMRASQIRNRSSLSDQE
ncbi:phage tail tape measure protein [Stutzerimonas stutzeri]|uniref:phage tail tape measure protein n=1 Tax=Stutzerimonas stutzeri TaxID=316 RepID=UPI0021114539|nr:phage tail tape measure protein [Stutzerimonas stutzeri]UUC83845.1 phage tail tape measure protein [Stutzerimonas stutzeri]